jgi:hypothetical protein
VSRPGREQLRLVDAAGEPGRTTATLLASLTARLATLYLVSGADAIGSLVAGYAELGREVARTAEGARLREALESGRAGTNGRALWDALRIREWASSLPPSPILDQWRNDVSLLLADDLEELLGLLPVPAETAGARGAVPTEEAELADALLGVWAFAVEAQRVIEALAAPTLPEEGLVRAGEHAPAGQEGSLLR